MILTHNDLQLMIDRFIDKLNDKYKDNKIEYYKLEKPVLLDFSNVDNEIIEDIEETDETDDISSKETTETEEIEIKEIEIKETTKTKEIEIKETTETKEIEIKEIKETTEETNKILSKKTIYSSNKKPDLPENFSLYVEKDVWYLSFSKYIDTIRYNKKIKLNSMCIQTELNRFIDIINDKYSDIKIEKYIVQNPYNFTDKTLLNDNNRPNMPPNFCVVNINKIDYIQFSKKINDKKVSYKKVIKSYDLQKELTEFVNYLNNEYKLNISSQKIIDVKNWKTTNNIK
jgi:hypothetical protein